MKKQVSAVKERPWHKHDEEWPLALSLGMGATESGGDFGKPENT